MSRTVVYGFLVLLTIATRLPGGPLEDCRALQHQGQKQQAAACFTRLTREGSAFLRAEGQWGLHRYDEANTEFKLAHSEQPQSALVRVEWGRLFLERFNPTDAANLFGEAMKLDANYAPAYLGMARVAAENYSKAAVDFAKQALERDPQYAEAHEWLSFLALEDSDEKLATEEANKALQLSKEALDGLAVLASIEYLHGQEQPPSMRRLLGINPVYGEGYETAAHFLVINRRYDEGIALYRKALLLSPDLWSAHSQLGINLMRLGKGAEAKTELTRCYDAHYRDAQTVNALRLLDTLSDYETFTSSNVELVLNKREAALLRLYVQPELEKAVATYSHKYQMQLPGRVRLEVYPNHDDFAVRVLGLPGQGGLLGVTFQTVVVMDSPSARAAGELNWASTMWHELNHVFVVTATHQLAPRWFVEGVAVHEEGVASARWGDRLTPQIVEALRAKKLLPVADLDRGFIRPEYPSQVFVSYYQAGRILDFIASKWGDAAIVGMIHDYSLRHTTTEAIANNLHETPTAFDRDFGAWLEKHTRNTVKRFDEWNTAMKESHAAFDSGNFAEAIRKATLARSIYPNYVQGGSAEELLADAHAAMKDKPAAMDDFEKYRDAGGTSVATLKKEAALEAENGRGDQARKTLAELADIFPQDEELHREWGELLLGAKDAAGAVREYQALLLLKPADAVDAHYRLASALNSSGHKAEAKEEVIAALEDAPRYRPAQRLLLQLTDSNE